MKLIKGTTEFQMDRPTALSLGKFDGLHRGHQLLLDRILEKKREGLEALVFAFDFGARPAKAFSEDHPFASELPGRDPDVLAKEVLARPALILPEERRRMLKKQGVDCLLECPFVPEIFCMDPETFAREVLVGRLHARYLAVGTDFRFGYHGKGDYQQLKSLGEAYGFAVDVVEKVCYRGKEISSTYIREELERGKIELVNRLLGYPYSVTGVVRHGRKIGRTLGMPTVNLLPEEQKLLPPNGVYATKSWIDGECIEGITNIGYKPTVGAEPRRGVETYLFDFDRDLYGEEITVEFYSFERPEQKFDSVEMLKEQLQKDMKWGKRYFTEEK